MANAAAKKSAKKKTSKTDKKLPTVPKISKQNTKAGNDIIKY
jgi:hypothetical protein